MICVFASARSPAIWSRSSCSVIATFLSCRSLQTLRNTSSSPFSARSARTTACAYSRASSGSVIPSRPAAQSPSSRFRRAFARNCISSSWANFASNPFSRSSNVVICDPLSQPDASAGQICRTNLPGRSHGRAPRPLCHQPRPGASPPPHRQSTALGKPRRKPYSMSRKAAGPCPRSCRWRVPMARRRLVYEGKAKILYEGPEPGTLVQHFKDDATAFNAKKKSVIDGKGVLNNRISEHIMQGLTVIGVPNHFIRRLNMREQLIRAVEIIPLEVVVRNIAAGSLSERLGIDEGTALPRPIVEFFLKDDALGDPMVTEEHIMAFNWASQQDMDDILSLALRVNDFLSGLFLGVGIRLVDFKIECGRIWDGDYQRVIVADEISPDSCRLWDVDRKSVV